MKFYIELIFKQFAVTYLLASIGAASFISLFQRGAVISIKVLWQILFVCFISAIITSVLLESPKEFSKKNIKFRMGIHFVLIYILIFGSGLVFDWISLKNIAECIWFSVMFFGIYAGVTIISYKRDDIIAEKLNEKIKYYNNDDE